MSELNPASPVNSALRSDSANPPPDWTTHNDEISCPLCGYNLRGLTDARCPECGYTFIWSQLVDPTNRKHPYLFEHHPEINIRSFLMTAVGGLRPKRFWTSLTPVQTFVPVRLLVYWLIAALIGVLTIFIASFYPVASSGYANPQNIVNYYQSPTGPILFPPPPRTPTMKDVIDYWEPEAGPIAVGFSLLLILWPWMTFMALMIFQISMRRAGVRKLHVLRTVLYSGDFVLWVGLIALIIGAVLIGVQIVFSGQPHDPPDILITWILIICWVALSHRLYAAYRRYLRFNHPLATVIVSQIVAFLTGLVAILFFVG